MNIVSAQSAHWTDEQLIEHLYGIGPMDGHLDRCEQCSHRLSEMKERRSQRSFEAPVSDDFLAAQRRAVYARLSERRRWWRVMPMQRWAAAAAMCFVLAGSAAVYEHHRRELVEARMDAQLAADVSRMSDESEPAAIDPLRGLFIE